MHIRLEDLPPAFAHVAAAALAGEEVVIDQAGAPVLKLVALPAKKLRPPPGGYEGWIAPDAFDPDPALEALFYGEE